MGTPCEHLSGGEMTGLLITSGAFGLDEQGGPNAVSFTRDTVCISELSGVTAERYNIDIATDNLGGVDIYWPPPPFVSRKGGTITASGTTGVERGTKVDLKSGKAVQDSGGAKTGKLQIIMDGKQASRLCKGLNVNILMPIHYEGWRDYARNEDEVIREFEDRAFTDRGVLAAR